MRAFERGDSAPPAIDPHNQTPRLGELSFGAQGRAASRLLAAQPLRFQEGLDLPAGHREA